MKKFLTASVMGLMLAWVAAPAHASYTLTLTQQGGNVVATGLGEIDLTGLSFATNCASGGQQMRPQAALLLTGSGGCGAVYGGAVGPSNFGTGSTTHASSSSGFFVGIDSTDLLVPSGYVSDSLLSSSATWDSSTFASLGVTPGTYVWSWGRGADQSFTLEAPNPVPLPGALWLMLSGLGGLGLAAHKRKAA